MLFKLSLKNIKKSIKDYAIYFFTLILGVAIFYVFNAIDDQTVMMNVSSSTYEIIKLLTSILSSVSVFVSFILALLIIYASRFLIKRRNKEFGIYLTLGMSKRKISLILFFETLIIGILSLAVGLGVGFILSQLMSIIVANMFEANLTKFTFIFSKSACLKTLLYFSIMYLIVMIFNTINISKCKLIDLIHSNKKSEKIKLKNPYICTVIFIISCIVLGFAYYQVTSGINNGSIVKIIYVPIILGAISTFFIFWSLSGLLLRIFMSIKKIYYKGLNSFTLRQFSSKINTTVFSTTIICLMLFITICVLSSALSMKNSLNKNLTDLSPRDIELSKSSNVNLEESDLTDIKKQNLRLNFEEIFAKFGFDIDANFKNTVYFSLYFDDSVTLKSTLGSYYKIAKKQYPYLRYNDYIILMTNSDYNNLAASFNLEKVTLKSNEYVVVGNYQEMLNIKNEALKRNTKITLNQKSYYPKYQKAINGFYEMGSQKSEVGFIVLPDNALSDDKKIMNRMIADYNGNQADIEAKINSITEKTSFYTDYGLTLNTKKDIRDASVGLGAIVTFLGLYLGIIFLISCAAILALKELSESSDNAEKFNMLRKIGVDEKMINKTLFRQIGIFFMFPLLLAIIHSIFGIMFCNIILKTMEISFNLKAVIITAILMVFIYGGYFLVTYICSKNIIKEK
ncbi:efflux ABC transporter permease protein [Clostridium sp. CAG:417]|nr:efflux ABC transporter permease protein [Clostridium sp. CAG:417]